MSAHRAIGAALAVALLLDGPAAPASAGAAARDADLVLVNGTVLTVDDHDRTAQAIAVRAGRIVAVGTNAEIRARARPGAMVVDLKGRTATPGLIDSHAHITSGGVGAVYEVDLGEARSVADVQRRLAARVAGLKPGQWLLGLGWDEGKLAEHRYLRASDLDAIVTANPVWLEHTTGHYGVANSTAMRLAGVDASTKDPPAGTIDRDASGAPSGVFKEYAETLVTHLIPATTVEEDRNGILASLALMHREGMTAVKDPDITATDWDAYVSLAREHRLDAHVCVLFHTDPTLESAQANVARLATLPKPPATAAENLTACGVKIYMDGSGAGRTAWVYEDWYRNGAPEPGNRGYPLVEPALYREMVRLYHGAGIHIGTHAIGDRAIDWVVDSYAAVLKERPDPGVRHAIIHANIPSAHAFDVMLRLQQDYGAGYPETQPPFTWWIGDNYAANLGPARLGRLNPYHSYRERGIRWAAGSDYPITPLAARYGLWASVARTTTHGAQPFGTAESVDALTALRSYTSWAAHQLFLEAESGSLEVGKSADLAVWDRNPLAVPTAQLKDMQCLLTVFRGKLVYRAPRSPLVLTEAR